MLPSSGFLQMSKLIRKRLPSSRHPVSEFQAHMLADLIDFLEMQACKKFKVADLRQCLPEQASKFTDLSAYGLFIQGAYACGFVMRDGLATDPLGEHVNRPLEWAADADFSALRQLVHCIVRSERHSSGYGSPVFEAMISGLLPAIGHRLRGDPRLYELQ